MATDDVFYDDETEPVYASLHFYYNDPDSMRRFMECMSAPDMKEVLFQFSQWLRGQIRYAERGDEDTLVEVYDKFWNYCESCNVDPWEE